MLQEAQEKERKEKKRKKVIEIRGSGGRRCKQKPGLGVVWIM